MPRSSNSCSTRASTKAAISTSCCAHPKVAQDLEPRATSEARARASASLHRAGSPCMSAANLRFADGRCSARIARHLRDVLSRLSKPAKMPRALRSGRHGRLEAREPWAPLNVRSRRPISPVLRMTSQCEHPRRFEGLRQTVAFDTNPRLLVVALGEHRRRLPARRRASRVIPRHAQRSGRAMRRARSRARYGALRADDQSPAIVAGRTPCRFRSASYGCDCADRLDHFDALAAGKVQLLRVNSVSPGHRTADLATLRATDRVGLL